MARPRALNLGHSSDGGTLRRIGGHPALDFANTVDLDRRQPDTLTDYPALVEWCKGGGLITSAEMRGLKAAAIADRMEAERQLREVLALRELAVRLYTAGVREKQPPDSDVASINALLRKYSRSSELTRVRHGYVRGPLRDNSELSLPMRQLLELIASFLTSPDLAHINMCAADHCGWFFVDRTPSRRRRWCSMQGCGNRAKAQLHYRRRRAAGRRH